MKGATIQQIGRILYGNSWRAPMERDFDISDRSLRRIVSGKIDAPSGLVRDLEMALRDRANRIDEMLEAFV